MLNQFSTKLALEQFIYAEVKKLNNLEEYNIFLHQIFPLRDPIENIARWVLNEGLECNHPSLNYTLMHIGSSKEINPQQIIEYTYNPDPNRHTLVFAVPKYIILNDAKLDYSTPTSSAYYGKIEPNYLLDNIKDYRLFPEYTLGYLQIEPKNNIFEFNSNDKHYSKLESTEKTLFDTKIANKVNDYLMKPSSTQKR